MQLNINTVEWAKLIIELSELKEKSKKLVDEISKFDEFTEQNVVQEKEELLLKIQQEIESVGVSEKEMAGKLGYYTLEPETDSNVKFKVEPDHAKTSNSSLKVQNGDTRISPTSNSFRPQKPPKFQKGDNFSRFARRFKEHVSQYTIIPQNLDLYMLSFIECETTWEKLSNLTLSDKEKYDIDELIKSFCNEIFPPTEARAMRTELLALRQRNSETIEDFCFRINECASKAAYSTTQMRD